MACDLTRRAAISTGRERAICDMIAADALIIGKREGRVVTEAGFGTTGAAEVVGLAAGF